jgi:hypothetical protein
VTQLGNRLGKCQPAPDWIQSNSGAKVCTHGLNARDNQGKVLYRNWLRLFALRRSNDCYWFGHRLGAAIIDSQWLDLAGPVTIDFELRTESV